MSDTDWVRRVLGLVIGFRTVDLIREINRDREFYSGTQVDVREAQWSADVFDWVIDHPDDLPDERGFSLLTGSRFHAASAGERASLRRRPIRRLPPRGEPTTAP